MDYAHQNRQSGYLMVGMGIVIGLLTIALLSTWKWAQHEGRERAKAEAQAASWKSAAEECSKGTEKAEKEAKERSRKAQDQLAKARKGSAKAQTEIERLKALVGKGTAASSCPSGDAVQQIRKGLK